MSGLHVPLDVEYASDDAIIEVGAMAELLFIRGLAFCKRMLSDGHITTRQLPNVARGIREPRTAATKLVQSGLWTIHGDGWTVTNWLRYNTGRDDVIAGQEMAKENGARGNHLRWHMDDAGKLTNPSPKCALCRTEHKRIGGANRNPIGGDIAKIETEPETQPEPETEPITTPSTSLHAVIHNLADKLRIDGTA